MKGGTLRGLFGMVALIALTGAGPDPEHQAIQGELREMERQREAAEANRQAARAELTATQTEIAVLGSALRSAVADLRQHEETIADIAASLVELEERRDARQAEFDQRREQSGAVVSALVRLTALPPEAALIQPGKTDHRLRSALVVRGMIPRLQHEAELLRQDIAAIRKAQSKVAAEKERLASAKADLERRYRALANIVEEKNALLADRSKEADRTAALAQRLARSAASLREFLGRIEAERVARAVAIEAEKKRRSRLAARQGLQAQPAPDAPPLRLAGFGERQGGLIAPLNGRVVYRFGEGEANFTEGITVGGSPGTPVLAPADGRVVYAGPFRDYGILLLIEHGGGFHSVLTGLGRSQAMAGQWVLAGEPLGRTAAHGSLYIEIRKGGQPVDPLAWFTIGRS